MDKRIDHIRTDAHAKLPDNEDAQTISQNSKRDHGQCQQHSIPRCAQEEIAGKQTGDEQYQGGMHSAACRGYLETETWQIKHKTLPEDRRGRHPEQYVGGLSGTLLEKAFDPTLQELRKRNGEDEKPHWESNRAQGLSPKKHERAGQKKQ